MGKHFIIFVTLTLSSVCIFAQDVIFKKDGVKINAKTLEITEQQIKYKDFYFQDGPIRNVNISDVAMIIYENGEKEIFNTRASTQPLSKPYNPFLDDLKREFDSIGSDDSAMLEFFRRNEYSEYSDRFESACRQKTVGTTLRNVGIGVAAAGVVVTLIGTIQYANADINDRYEEDRYVVFSTVGVSMMLVGEGLIIASIPVSITAGARKRFIKNDFEKEYFGDGVSAYQPKLNFGTTAHGIGLTLKF